MPITLAVFGLGDIARKAHLPVLAARSDVQVVGLISRTGRGAAELAARYRFAPTAHSLEDVLRLRPDAAVVLSSSETHAEITCQLLEAGIAVYVEKPMAPELPASREMATCARRTGTPLMVGFNRRYAPFYQEARALFGEGPPSLCTLVKHRDGIDRVESPSCVVWDDVIHLVDLSRWLMGEPERLSATLERGPQGEFRSLTVLLGYPGGRAATLTQSRVAGGVTERLELHGHGRSVWVEEMESLHLLRDGVTEVRQHPRWRSTLARRGFEAALDHFLAVVREGKPLAQPPEDALRSHELAQRILEEVGAAES